MDRFVREVTYVGIGLLQDWGLMCVDFAADECKLFECDGELSTAQSSFSVPQGIAGTVSISCQNGFMRKLSKNVLGESDRSQLSAGVLEDGLKELTNMLTGLLVARVCGDDAPVRLSVPVYRTCKLTDAINEFDEGTTFFIGDGEPIAISCRIFGK